MHNFSIVGRESENITRSTKETLYIRLNDPSLNRSIRSFSCPTFGMISCSTPLTCNLNRPFHIFRCSFWITHSPSWWEGGAGSSQSVSTTHNSGYVCSPTSAISCHNIWHHVTHHTANGARCGEYKYWKYNIFHRPDEVILFVMVKACLHLKNILLFRALQSLFFL